MLEQHEMKTIHCRGLCKSLPSFPKPERVLNVRVRMCVFLSLVPSWRSIVAIKVPDLV